MSLEDGVCGTGGWSGPLPGDPDTTNISLSANTSYGGITVSWSYPLVNGHAVAHTLLYRGLTNEFANASQRAVVAGTIFFDEIAIEVPTQYYYWIRVISINGTPGELIGPASAEAIPRVTQTLESLTGRIDSELLANALKTDFASIALFGQNLENEVQNRISGNVAMGNALAAVQAETGELTTYILNETTTRATADSAQVSAINALAVGMNNNAAAIVTEATVRLDQDNALAGQVATAITTLNGNIAGVQTLMQSNINTVDGKVTEIGALYTAKVSVNGLVGGFGIYNNGQTVEAGFDVDNFWVGRTNNDKVKPFIISGGIVYMDKARIRDADIDTLKIAGNAITAATHANAFTYHDGINGPLLTSTMVNVCTTQLTVPNLGAGQTAGTVITGYTTLYAANVDAHATVGTYILVNGNLLTEAACTLGESKTVTVVGYIALPPGTHTVAIAIKTGSPGGATKSLMCVSAVVVMSAKR